MSAEDLAKAIDEAQKRVDDLRAQGQQKNGTTTVGWLQRAGLFSFFSSGIFFLLLGGAFLFVAQHYMATNHAGITFILVVLGVALMLYGTGTQGMGQFKSGSAATYNVAIAGGAGVIAFIVAYGIIVYSPKMREAFQPERKFVRVLIQSDDGSTRLPQYVSSFDIDGVSIPAARRGNLIEVYVPFVAYELPRSQTGDDNKRTTAARTDFVDKAICTSEDNQQALAQMSAKAVTKTISAMFYRVDPGAQDDVLADRLRSVFHVKLDQSLFQSIEAGSDYPEYPVRMCVNLQSKNKINLIANASGQQLQSAAGTDKPKPLEPAIIQPN